MSEQQIPIPQKPYEDDEIDLLAHAKTIWNGRKTIILTVIITTILGIIAALSAAKEYTASTVIVPQLDNSQSRLGGLGGLAALAGISTDMSQGSDLSPIVYPQIISSIPYQIELMNMPLRFRDYPTPLTFFEYCTKEDKPTAIAVIKKYTIGLPGLILGLPFKLIGAIRSKPKELSLPSDSSNLPIILSEAQVEVLSALSSLVTIEIATKEGYITLKAIMPEALAAAQLAKNAQILLQRYITEFRIEKAKNNLKFIQGRYDETKVEFEKAQVSLALINDRNKNFMSGLSKIETERTQAQYTIIFSIFQELAKQLEQAKIQVKKETPTFAIVKPVVVPSLRSKPNRPLIVFIWIFLGVSIGLGIVFGKGFFNSIKEKWNEEENNI